MTSSFAFRLRAPLATSLTALGLSALLGCTGQVEPSGNNPMGTGALPGSGATGGSGGAGAGGSNSMAGSGVGGSTGGMSAGGAASGSGGTGAGAGGTGGMVPQPTGCDGVTVTTQKRVVKLTDNQLVNTYTAIFQAATDAMFMGEAILPATQRAFPPLATLGTALAQTEWDLRDRVAKKAMTHVAANLATLTTCGATPSDATCGLDAVLAFAEKAYRRPLLPEETANYQALWTELTTTNGGSVAEAIRFGFDAVLLSPGFLYRTEYGGSFATEGPMDQYELASELSYFLLDGPPDAELLTAAQTNQLADKAVIRTHARRILESPAARANLEAAMIGYFQLTTVPTVVIDEGTIDDFNLTAGVRSSMYREGEEFIKNTLWAGPLSDLVTSRRSWINSQVAPIYGITAPSQDVNTFSEVMLPEGRSGLLTLSPFLISKSRPDGTSVVGRGLALNAALVCSENPAFPEDDPEIVAAIASQEGWTEKQKADARVDNPTCRGCHAQFDAMGLVLENFDAIGRFRDEDPAGNPIDVAWTTSNLPDSFDYDQNADGVPDPNVVTSAPSLALALTRDQPLWGSNALTRCMAMNFINFALADESQGSARASNGVPPDSCAVRAVTNSYASAPEKTFAALLAEIAASDTLSIRKPGM